MDDKHNSAKYALSDQKYEALRIEIVRMLYEGSTRSLIVSTLVAAMLIFTELNDVGTSSLWIWAAVYCASYGTRYLIAFNYHRQEDRNKNSNQWLALFRYSTAACGLTWGLAGFLFYVESADTTHQALLIIILIGVVGGAIITYSIDSVTAKLFAGGLLLLTLPSFLFPATLFSFALAVMLVIYILYVSISGATLAKKLRENMLMRITAREQDREIKALAERQKLHVDLTPMGVIEWDADFKVASWNKSAENIFQYTADEALGMHIHEITPIEKQDRVDELISQLLSDGAAQCFHDDNLRHDGRVIYCEWIFTVLRNKHNRVVGLASLVQDKSAFKKNQDEINFLAYYDLLTNLPNRRLLMTKLEQAILTTKRSKLYSCAMFIDLDNFKDLNDLHGHQGGDLLLQEVSHRLKLLGREEDIISRFAGDEFVMILERLGETLDEAMASSRVVVKKVMAEMNRIFLLGEYEYRTSSSIGVCLFQGDDLTADEILKRADIAMYQAKKAGRNCMQFFNVDLQPKLELRASLASDLRGAELNVELLPYYQAQVNHHNQVIGAELLLRWIHPKHGFIPPDEFIPIAEESRLINSIGLSILRHACHQISLWQANPKTQQLRLSINISARHFGQDSFVDEVKQALKDTGCAPELLRLELTESLMQKNIVALVSKMKQLKSIGVSLSLDDFGTGYSSLSSLRSFPLDELKIDRSFVNDISSHESDTTIIEMIIEISKKLGMEVIAEGVETDEQETFLRNAGCLFYQGYKFGRPVPLEEFEQQL